VKISETFVWVDDAEKALQFYTEVLGFVKKSEIWTGRHARRDLWMFTVVSPDDPEGIELLLEPDYHHPEIKLLKEAYFEETRAFLILDVDDVQKEFERLRDLGVRFTLEPSTTDKGEPHAMLDDTCGNIVSVVEASRE
jgi:catechol 2,3-dioxygenase-like lactoylglutathione lyase family enzyme